MEVIARSLSAVVARSYHEGHCLASLNINGMGTVGFLLEFVRGFWFAVAHANI